MEVYFSDDQGPRSVFFTICEGNSHVLDLFYGKEASQRRTLNPKTQVHTSPIRSRFSGPTCPTRASEGFQTHLLKLPRLRSVKHMRGLAWKLPRPMQDYGWVLQQQKEKTMLRELIIVRMMFW